MASVTFNRCIFSENGAGSGKRTTDGFLLSSFFSGGAIFGVNANTVVSGCKFLRNLAFYDGAAISPLLGNLTVTDSDFIGNTANTMAGAISSVQAQMIVQNSRCVYHLCILYACCSRCRFYSNGATDSGGAIAIQCTTVSLPSILDCEFTR